MENKQHWHISDWSLLGWIETLVKITAFIFAGIFIFGHVQSISLLFPKGIYLAVWVIQVLLSLGLIGAIFDRYLEKEIIAFSFVLLNNLFHWGIVFALLNGAERSFHFFTFLGLMLVGDLIKLIFLKTTNFQVRDIPKTVLYGLTGFYIIGYSIQILLLLLKG